MGTNLLTHLPEIWYPFYLPFVFSPIFSFSRWLHTLLILSASFTLFSGTTLKQSKSLLPADWTHYVPQLAVGIQVLTIENSRWIHHVWLAAGFSAISSCPPVCTLCGWAYIVSSGARRSIRLSPFTHCLLSTILDILLGSQVVKGPLSPLHVCCTRWTDLISASVLDPFGQSTALQWASKKISHAPKTISHF